MGGVEPGRVVSRGGAEIEVRSAVPADAAAVLAHSREVLEDTEYFITRPEELTLTEEDEERYIRSHLDLPGRLMLGAFVGSRVVGLLTFNNGRRARVFHQGTFGISVSRDFRGKGVGGALIGTFLEWAESNPLIEKVGLSVFDDNDRAMALYRKYGFVEEGRKARAIKFDEGRYKDEIIMGRFVGSGR